MIDRVRSWRSALVLCLGLAGCNAPEYPSLEMLLSAPAEVALGEPFHLTGEVKNEGKRDAYCEVAFRYRPRGGDWRPLEPVLHATSERAPRRYPSKKAKDVDVLVLVTRTADGPRLVLEESGDFELEVFARESDRCPPGRGGTVALHVRAPADPGETARLALFRDDLDLASVYQAGPPASPGGQEDLDRLVAFEREHPGLLDPTHLDVLRRWAADNAYAGLRRPGDLDHDDDVDLRDRAIVEAAVALQTPPRRIGTEPFDRRDLDQDGDIDAHDAEALEALCTRPGCALQ